VRQIDVATDKFEGLDKAVCMFAQFRLMGTTDERPFLFVIIEGEKLGYPKGVIVSNQLHNHKPTIKLINLYNEIVGKEQINKEKELFDKLFPYIQKAFPEKRYTIEVQPSPDEKRKVALGTEKVKNEYEARFGEISRSTYVVPDFVLYDKKWSCKQLFIEVERGKRNVEEIKRKLWKLHYLDKKIFFIFENEYIRDHYLEAIYEFQQEVVNGKKRKFKSLNYTTKDEFMFFANEHAFTRFT
jgi:hypothetical protein